MCCFSSSHLFLQIKTFNKDNVSNSLMTKVKKYINNPDFSFENVAKVCIGT